MSVTLYSKNNCPACERAKALLKAHNIAYNVKNIDTDLDAMDFVVAKGHRAMPVIYDGERHVKDAATLVGETMSE